VACLILSLATPPQLVFYFGAYLFTRQARKSAEFSFDQASANLFDSAHLSDKIINRFTDALAFVFNFHLPVEPIRVWGGE